MIEPLQLSFEVSCDTGHAFEVWTRQISHWWPPDHTVSGNAAATVLIEPRVGGRILERTPDGREHEWGQVTVWEPPARLAYLWHLGADRSEATDVEIAFVPISDSTTRINVVHSGWERLGPQGAARRNTNRAGWDHVVPAYLERCAGV